MLLQFVSHQETRFLETQVAKVTLKLALGCFRLPCSTLSPFLARGSILLFFHLQKIRIIVIRIRIRTRV